MKQIRTMVLNLLFTKIRVLGPNLGILCIRAIWKDAKLALYPLIRTTALPQFPAAGS